MSNKVAAYLRSHLAGEVVTRSDVRQTLSRDFGVLEITPELVVYPKTTNDIRKVARFTWQLAEKGHVLPITVRGAGTGVSGGALGDGVSIVTTAHMNRIYEYDSKQRLIRLQPGVTVTALEQALTLDEAGVPQLCGLYPYGTIGGAIGDGSSGQMSGKYGDLAQAIDKLEVILASGDVLQTGRISRKELQRKKGLQGMEGDIYRGVDAVLDDFSDVIDALDPDDQTGYGAIANVRHKDGSIDLAPLFVGSQGTLGIISEMILKTNPVSAHPEMAALVYKNREEARDALDLLAELHPCLLEYFDSRLFDTAAAHGKEYAFFKQATQKHPASAVIAVGFDDPSERARHKSMKKVVKIAEKSEAAITIDRQVGAERPEIASALDVIAYGTHPDSKNTVAPDIFSGFTVPSERFEDFLKGLGELEEKLHLELPLSGQIIAGRFAVHPSFSTAKVSDKQKMLKTLDELTKLVLAYDGSMVAGSGEGRLKTHFVYARLDDRIKEMHAAIRTVFDPRGTLNPGVKQPTDLRKLAGMVHNVNARADLARFK